MLQQCDSAGYLDCLNVPSINDDTSLHGSYIDTYDCASGETGPEVAYGFSSLTDIDLTVTLHGGTSDLDLIVLDGAACVSTASCIGKSVTAQTGEEKVAFHAAANHPYMLVVDGQGGARGPFTLSIDCPTCKPIKTLACNTSVAGDSSSASATKALASYLCDSNAAGPEDTYALPTADLIDVKMTGLTSDLDLIVVRTQNNQCITQFCFAQSITAGNADEQLSFMPFAGTLFDVVVDTAGSGGPYQLELACPPSCATQAQTIDCTNNSVSGKTAKYTNNISSWACDSGTTGRETSYLFRAPMDGMYTFQLSGLSADLDLLVLKGDYGLCDPLVPCVASSTKLGNSSESLTFMANASQYYWIIIDGKSGATSAYTLTLTCP
jgi:hypothetical protein